MSSQDSVVKFLSAKPELIALFCLLAVELLCFGPVLQHIGFYLDDWSMFRNLHFGPQSLLGLTQQCLQDSKVIVRPLEGPYFAVLYLLSNGKPLAGHLINGFFEVASSWFLFLTLSRVTRSNTASLAAALVFLLIPTHDATHYWITASSVTVSLAFYNLSLWQMVVSIEKRSILWLLLSAASFAISVFNYEAFIPLCALNLLCACLLLRRREGLPHPITRAFLVCLPYPLVIASMWAYRKFVMPLFGPGWAQAPSFDVTNFATVIWNGVTSNFSFQSAAFFWQQGQEYLLDGFSPSRLLILTAAVLISAACLYLLSEKGESGIAPAISAGWILTGFAAVLVSYTIFGIATGYTPCLNTILNRVNSGASIGAAIVITGLAGASVFLIGRTVPKFKPSLWSLVMAPVVGSFILANWGLSKPWILSWATQKQIQQSILGNAQNLRPGDSIVLANCPRYVMWAPLFDGVWDFQNMLQFKLNRKDISGSVVSERLKVSRAYIEDVASGYSCGAYEFGHLLVFIPAPPKLIRVESAEDFVELVEKEGMTFGLDPEMPTIWRTQLASSQQNIN